MLVLLTRQTDMLKIERFFNTFGSMSVFVELDRHRITTIVPSGI